MSEHEPHMVLVDLAGTEIATFREADLVASWRGHQGAGVVLRPYGLVLRVDTEGKVTTEWPPSRPSECEACGGRGEVFVHLDNDYGETWERCEACMGAGR